MKPGRNAHRTRQGGEVTMAFTTTQLDALRDAYARGVTTVKHNDKVVTYGSMEELWRAIQRLERALASPSVPTYVRLTSKGY